MKEGAALEQVMFQRVASRGGSGGDAQLAVDGAHMRIDSDQADDELVGNLCAGQSLDKQAQYVHFTWGQACRRDGWHVRLRSRWRFHRYGGRYLDYSLCCKSLF